MKIVLFGTGDYYNKYKKWFIPDDIVALLDNNPDKAGMVLDGHSVIQPMKIRNLYYDYIIILSVHEKEMRKQLVDLGVEDNKIIASTQLFRHPELTRANIEKQIFLPRGISKANFASINKQNGILMMSYDLNLNGASLALYYAAICLYDAGYRVVVASWDDGQLRSMLNDKGIPVIVDQNLELKTAKQIPWIKDFSRIFCNTIVYYIFLSDRDVDARFIWWLHDPEIFYENLDKRILRSIPLKNLHIFAVGDIAENAIKRYIPHVRVEKLLYGIPDVKPNRKVSKLLEVAVIANVQDYKGQDILIDALKKLTVVELKQIHVRIIGNQNSSYAKNLASEAIQLGKSVEFIPSLNRNQINEVYDELDILVVPSRTDTMPVTAAEAMQHHVVPLLSDVVGTTEYIEDGVNGIIFESENSYDLARKIRWCISHQNSLSMIGDNARDTYDHFFFMNIFKRNFIDIIKNYFE